MASYSSDSNDSVVSSVGDWDQPGNVVDTLGVSYKPVPSMLERELHSKYSFDRKWKEFSDVKLYDMQNSIRFRNLLHFLKFPCCPLYSSIMCCFKKEDYRFKTERLIQRRICQNFCNWDPSRCFLEDSHSGIFEDLMSVELHSLYNPEFESQFSQGYIYPQLVYPQSSPPDIYEFIEKIGISSELKYKDGIAVNLEHLSNHYRKKGSSIFTFEEKKVHDIIEGLLEASNVKINEQKRKIKKVYEASVNSSGTITKPIISLMMWGPQPNNNFPSTFQECDLEYDTDHKEIHTCLNFLSTDFWMFKHAENISCIEANSRKLEGPAMTQQLAVVYPCDQGKCNVNCVCKLCEKTKSNMCPIAEHKDHLRRFEPNCLIQKESQCQIHWVGHPNNFDNGEDIVVENNLFYHNKELVEQPRSYKVAELKFSNIKKSCQLCRNDVEDHFKNHLVFHV